MSKVNPHKLAKDHGWYAFAEISYYYPDGTKMTIAEPVRSAKEMNIQHPNSQNKRLAEMLQEWRNK